MTDLICPVCGARLMTDKRTYFCQTGHCYDRAKDGYVNLLLRQNKGAHGDNRPMLIARRDFLDRGYYAPLSNRLAEVLTPRLSEDAHLLDAGCGEGYYASVVARQYPKTLRILGIDISKEALRLAAKRLPDAEFAVGSLYALPVLGDSQDAVSCFFAPLVPTEFLRVLKSGGCLVMAVPGKRHLYGMKKVLYETPYENEVRDPTLDGFLLEEEHRVENQVVIQGKGDIGALFAMTPYFYRTSSEGRARLEALDCLETELSFRLLVYRKNS